MKTSRFLTTLSSILEPVPPTVAAVAIVAASTCVGQAQDYTNDWNYRFAYTLGVQAYIYGFPWINMAQYRWEWVPQPPTPENDHACAPLNQFSHARTLQDPS